MKVFEDIYEAYRPLYYLSIITATTSIIRNKTGEWVKTNIQIVQSVVFVTICTTLALLSFKGSVYPFPVLEKSGIIVFITNIYLHGINIMPVCMFIITQIFAKTKITVLKGINDIDLTLKKMGLQSALSESNYILWKYTIILLTILYFLNFVIIAVVTLIFYAFPIYQMVTYLFSYIINMIVKLQYYSWTVVLRERFKILNNLLQMKITESSTKVKYPPDEDLFSQDIEMIAEQHKRLTKTARSINLCYSFPLLSIASFNFVVLITQGYILIYVLTLGHTEDSNQDYGNNFLIVNSLQFVLTSAFELFVLIRFTTLMCFQVQHNIIL